MERVEIASLYKATPADGTRVTVCGWAKTVRDSKKIGFISLTDGSCYKPVQIVFQADKLENYTEIAKSGLYTSFEVNGTLVLTPEAKQPFEINADSITVLGACGPEYPLQKKKMSPEYLRTMTHLRPRTNTFNAAYRVRGQAAYALHQFFHENGFTYVHTPIFTGSDCEGAGEMFQVTTMDLDNIPRTQDGAVDYSRDFFKRPVNLTVSGQLEAEALAMALGKVYTFGPTFRAEKSYDTRHAAEFWMIEPEMAFADLNTYMDTAEAMTKYVIRFLLDNCPDELAFFNQFFDKGLIERLELVASSDFARVSYTDAIELLKKNNDNFQYKVEWGIDLQTEHERYLTEQIFKKPVFVTDYPKEIKAFYMRLNEDGRTVAAADMLVPGIGELIGGSQREERYDVLTARMQQLGMKLEDYDWYLDLRRFGSVKHAGYGLGFERLIMYVTGIPNIRDVLPFPPHLRRLLMGGVSEPLIRWFEQHRRLLPFRQEPSAYHIWISEIMLQQTRVSAALPYYERFVVELPDPAALAACEPDRLRKLWQGLGYYSRAANLQKAAGILCDRYGGELPADYDALRALPGIGDYTAGAIASIAFGIPVPAVDGNVLRVFARLTNDDSDITRPETKRSITRLVMEEMPRDRPGAYNEALMELGALVCLPNGAPRCGECPLAGQCAGRAAGRAETLPNKPPKPAKTVVPVTVALITGPRGVLLQRRPAKGLLAGLWQPPAFEADHPLTREELDARLRALGLAVRWTGTLPPARHVFTHRVWQLSGFCAASGQEVLPGSFVWADLPALEREYSVPSAFSAYVSEGKIREKQEENARILT